MQLFDTFGSVADWLQILLALVASWVAWRQWRQACEVTRSEHLRELMISFKDENIQKVYYRYIDGADYGGGNEEFYLGQLRFTGGSETEDNVEENIDSMLLVFSSICHEYALRVIRADEFEFFSYQIHRTLAHREVKDYLKDFLSHAIRYRHGFPFSPLLLEGRIVDEDWYAPLCEWQSSNRR